MNVCEKYLLEAQMQSNEWVEFAFIPPNTIMIGVKQLCHKHDTLTNCCSSALRPVNMAYLSSDCLVVVTVVGIHKTQNKLHTQNLESKVLDIIMHTT
jgi:hypothetical protein